MKLATARTGDSRVVVALDEGRYRPLPFNDLTDVIRGGEDALQLARRALRSAPHLLDAEMTLEAPIQRFRRDILCTGWNYSDHYEEGVGLRRNHETDRPDRPTFFTKSPDTVIGPYDDIAFDETLSEKWDFEAELAIVFGKTGRSIPEHRAMEHVWGYFLANDISQRDLQHAHGGQWLKGKSLDRTMPIGPVVVTADEIDPSDVHLECVVNGTVMQSASTGQMAFPIPRLVAELSEGMTVRAGDILLTGTPSGVGNARVPQVFLRAGDEVTVRASGIGELCNKVVATALSEYSTNL